ncbi:MAG TPA: serine/threonine-protein kinase [Candidatus Obscuribacterales bacterium]
MCEALKQATRIVSEQMQKHRACVPLIVIDITDGLPLMQNDDLKPSNIMLIESADGRTLVKIVDFGIAKIIPRQAEESLGLTRTGEVFGSPLYMSPEQCMGRSLDHRSDIHSFGCVMYETLCGKPPFVGAHVLETLHRHMHEPAPPLTVSGCPDFMKERLDRTIFKSLEKDPATRFQSMLQLKQELEALRSPAEAGSKPTPANRVSRLARQIRRCWGAHPKMQAPLALTILSILTRIAASKSIAAMSPNPPEQLYGWFESAPRVVAKPYDFETAEREARRAISLLNRIVDLGAKQTGRSCVTQNSSLRREIFVADRLSPKYWVASRPTIFCEPPRRI